MTDIFDPQMGVRKCLSLLEKDMIMLRLAVVTLLLVILPSFAIAQEETQVRQRTHEVLKGETLWTLASRYLGDPYRWPLIFEANAELVSNPDLIEPGQILVIPGLVPQEAREPEVVGVPEVEQVGEVARVQGVAVTPGDRPPTTGRVASRPRGEVTSPWPRTSFYPRHLAEPDIERMASMATPQGRASYGAVVTSAVPLGFVYSSEWFVPAGGEVSFIGTVADFPKDRPFENPRNPFGIGQRLPVQLEDGVVLRIGDLIQTFRTVREERRFGSVQRPTGVLVVTGVEGGEVQATVSEEFGRISSGDKIRLAPVYLPVPGVLPTPTESNITAEVLGFPEERPLRVYGSHVFLSVGADEGVVIGDVFRAFKGEPGPGFGMESVRIQVILVEGNLSTGRIVSIRIPGLQVGDRLRLIEKMY